MPLDQTVDERWLEFSAILGDETMAHDRFQGYVVTKIMARKISRRRGEMILLPQQVCTLAYLLGMSHQEEEMDKKRRDDYYAGREEVIVGEECGISLDTFRRNIKPKIPEEYWVAGKDVGKPLTKYGPFAFEVEGGYVKPCRNYRVSGA